MSRHILKCSKCSTYTIEIKCKKCGGITLTTKPAKYSPIDSYGKYRREYKKNESKI